MNARQFVDAIRRVVLKAAVSDTLAVVQNPPGRRPAQELVDVSRWYNALDAADQAMVGRMLEITARQALFGFLSVLDGSRQVEGSGPKGYFELRHVKDEKEDVVSGPNGEVLHELLE